MNKSAIASTAVCHFDPADKCFIVQSPLYDSLIGAADSESEAWTIFNDFLDDAYTSYLEGRLGGMYSKRGRPAKNRTGIHCEVKPETRNELRSLAARLGCSQGETIDYLTAFFKAKSINASIKHTSTKKLSDIQHKTGATKRRAG